MIHHIARATRYHDKTKDRKRVAILGAVPIQHWKLQQARILYSYCGTRGC